MAHYDDVQGEIFVSSRLCDLYFCSKMNTHLHRVAKVRISGSVPPVPHMSLWLGQEKFYPFMLSRRGDILKITEITPA